jgi:superoxide reductase
METRRKFFKKSAFAAAAIIGMNAKLFAGEKKGWPAGIVYTADSPGRWEKKAGSHAPKVKTENGKIKVDTPHPMTKEHYIVKHTLLTADGKVLGEKTFYPDDPRASSEFDLPKGEKLLYVTSFCNKHDLWLTEIKL